MSPEVLEFCRSGGAALHRRYRQETGFHPRGIHKIDERLAGDETAELLPREIEHVFLAVERSWQLLKHRFVRVLRAMRLRSPAGIAAASYAGRALTAHFSFALRPSGRLRKHRDLARRFARAAAAHGAG